MKQTIYFKAHCVFAILSLICLKNTQAQEVCNCTDYIYLNDIGDESPGNGKIYKWKVDPATGDLTEITQPNGDQWLTGLTSPHGIGTDLNGDIYFGNRSVGPIYKIDCNGGTLVNDAEVFDDTRIKWDLYNIGSYQNYIFANGGGPNTSRNEISVFNTCGDFLGKICLNYPDNDVPDWGLEVLDDGTILASVGAFGDSPSAIFRFQFEESMIGGACIDPIIDGSTPQGSYLDNFESIWGITSDGTHLYVLATASRFSDSYLLKIDIATGNLVSQVQESSDPTAGWDDALGIVYLESVDLLYIAGRQDCISLVDPSDLSYVKGFGTVGPNDLPKGIAYVTECCPTSPSTVIDTTLCGVSINDEFSIQDYVGCDGAVCEGNWELDPSSTGIVFDPCDNSFTLTSANACGTFILSSDGTGSTAQCGAFEITLNIETLAPLDVSIVGDQEVCVNARPDSLVVTTTGTVVGWESSTISCSEGFTTIEGTSGSSFSPGPLSQTTYFRAIVQQTGDCSTGNCEVPTECVTVTVVDDCSYGSVGDYVWIDANKDGIQDAGEDPVDGLTVYLLDENDTILDSTMTDANGLYLFDSLSDGNYKVQFDDLEGFERTTKDTGTDDTDDSDADPVTGISDLVSVDTSFPVGSPERDNRDVDAGYTPAEQFGSIGDYVWVDVDRDGAQDPTEDPVVGATVYLLDENENIIDSTLTLLDGSYLFDDLPSGNYKVQFVKPDNMTDYTTANSGDDTMDSDAGTNGISDLIVIDVNKDESDILRNNLTIDAGFICNPSITASPDQEVCVAADLTTYTMSVVTGPVTSQQWYGPLANVSDPLGSPIAGAVNPTFTPQETDIPTAGSTVYFAVIGINGSDPACADTAYVALTAREKPILTIAETNLDCNMDASGIVDLTINGGQFPYNILWSNGATSEDLINVPAGNYSVTVTDANGCISEATAALSEPDQINLSVDASSVNCQGGTDGVVSSMVSGGVGPYTFAWYNGNGTNGTQISTDPMVTGLANGVYTLQVVDSLGCAQEDVVTITDGVEINTMVMTTNNECFDENKGAITLMVNGATTPYTSLTWTKDGQSLPAFDGLTQLDNLGAGVYEFMLDDANGCMVAGKDTITEPTELVALANPVPPTCDNSLGGLISTNVTGGVAPYTYEWSDGSTLESLSMIPAGTYTLIVTDAKNCKDTVEVLLAAPNCEVDLALSKTTDAECQQEIGSIITFEVTLTREDLANSSVDVIVRDSLTSNLEFVSASTSNGNYDHNLGIWSGITLGQGGTATLTMQAKLLTSFGGLACNTAWIDYSSRPDADSTPGNMNDDEDDISKACVSIPIQLCTERGESIILTAPQGYASYQWFRDGAPIQGATSNSFEATEGGVYTIDIQNGEGCGFDGCCPIIIEDICPCPENICIPFMIKKTK